MQRQSPMKDKQRPDEPITFGERLAAGCVSAVAAGLTLLAYLVIAFVLSSKYSGPPGILFEAFSAKLFMGVIATGFVVGFLLGGARMAEVFASFWGTSEPGPQPWFIKVIAAAVIVAIVLAVLR